MKINSVYQEYLGNYHEGCIERISEEGSFSPGVLGIGRNEAGAGRSASPKGKKC